MTLRVVEPGLYTLVVDLGRHQHRGLGVPVGGAADRAALVLGNALVGNPPDAAALEICLAGPTLQAETELACAFFGAPFDLTHSRAGFPEKTIRAGKSFTLTPGDQLRIGGTLRGMRGYLCVRGGFQVPTILDSRSGLGPVEAGLKLSCLASKIHSRYLPAFISNGKTHADMSVLLRSPHLMPAPVRWPLRVVAGLQSDWFAANDFYSQDFTITPAGNRMGLRLQGRPLNMPERELVSEPVCPGAVQVTRDGQCIILGMDGQTIGGYPKIAQVISADLDHLGQLRPGDIVHFVQVQLADAVELYRGRRKIIDAWVSRLRTALDAFPGGSQRK